MERVEPWAMTHISEESIPVRPDADDLDDDSSADLSMDGEVENNLAPKFDATSPLKNTLSKHSQMT